MSRPVKKICFAASSGGHFEQLMMLKPLMYKYDSFILTERAGYEVNVPVRSYWLRQVTRHDKLFIPRMIFNTVVSLKVYIQERPDVVVCTGVLATIPMCFISKLFGGELVYIESFAKLTSGTETGRLMSRFADRFYVQWESMLDVYPRAVYVGSVY